MLRITKQDTAEGPALKLEGCLIGAWVGELDSYWRAATRNLDRGPIVDLSEVSYVDDAGRQLLTLMHRAGARFRARGCAMREMVREISESTDSERGN